MPSDHPQHLSCHTLVDKQDKQTGATSSHCLAEVYANLTGMPGRQRVSPEEALLYLTSVRDTLKIVTLTEAEVVDALAQSASIGIAGGGIYDALIGRAAVKSKAQHIYTLNQKHFLRLGDVIARKVKRP